VLEALALVLVPALAVAVNPVPVMASLAMAAVDRGVTLALVFAAGWMLGLVVESYVVLLLVDGFLGGATSQTWDWVHVTLAVLMLLLSLRLWLVRGRGGSGPQWLDEVDRFTVPRTLGVGVSLAAASPRVVVFTVAAMAALVQSEAPASGLLWFVLVGSAGVVVPVVVAGLHRDHAVAGQQQWWRAHHLPVAVTVLWLVAATQLAAAALARPA
jgi:hypothetical protein